MPLREYECDACGHRFEVIQKMSDPPLEACPKCGGALRKLQAAPAFHLKGSGWYITDYAKKDQSSAKSEDEAKGAVKSSTDTGEAKTGETKTGESKTGETTKGETKTDTARSSGSGDAASSSGSSTPSSTPARTPAKDS